MARVYDYKLELCWLVILVLLFSFVPKRSSAGVDFSWDDVPDWCGDGDGTCVRTCCF